MVYFVGHFNIEDVYYPSYSRLGTAGGACLYAAMGARIWTDRVAVVSRIGDNYPKDYLRKLKNMGVALHLRLMPGPTMASRTEYAQGKDRVFTMKNPPERLDELTPDVEDVQAAQIPAGSFVHLSAMNLEKLERIVDHLRKKDCYISVDTCDAFVRENWKKLLAIVRKADLFLPSRAEIYACPVCCGEMESQIQWLQSQLGSVRLVVKDSSNGCYLAQPEGLLHIPVFPNVDAVDLTGAGDSFCGGLLACISRDGFDLARGCAAGTVSASYIIQQAGAFATHEITAQDRDLRLACVQSQINGREFNHG